MRLRKTAVHTSQSQLFLKKTSLSSLVCIDRRYPDQLRSTSSVCIPNSDIPDAFFDWIAKKREDEEKDEEIEPESENDWPVHEETGDEMIPPDEDMYMTTSESQDLNPMTVLDEPCTHSSAETSEAEENTNEIEESEGEGPLEEQSGDWVTPDEEDVTKTEAGFEDQMAMDDDETSTAQKMRSSNAAVRKVAKKKIPQFHDPPVWKRMDRKVIPYKVIVQLGASPARRLHPLGKRSRAHITTTAAICSPNKNRLPPSRKKRPWCYSHVKRSLFRRRRKESKEDKFLSAITKPHTAKKADDAERCGCCGKTEEDDQSVERWIMCEMLSCQQWFHLKCLGIRRAPKGAWTCPKCHTH